MRYTFSFSVSPNAYETMLLDRFTTIRCHCHSPWWCEGHLVYGANYAVLEVSNVYQWSRNWWRKWI